MSKGEPIQDGSFHDATAMLLAYLAGDLSAEEQEAFEHRLLDDEFFSQQIEEARFALLEAYAEGSLTGAPKERVAAAWVEGSPYTQRQVEVTRSLLRLASPGTRHSVAPRRLWALGLAACLVFAVVVSLRWHHATPSAPAPLVAKSEPPSPPSPASAEDTILLVAERLRGAETSPQPSATYHLHTALPVRVQVVVPPSHMSAAYAVLLNHAENHIPVAQWSAVRVQGTPQAPFVEVLLHHALEPGEYVTELRAQGDIFHVRFRIAPEK